MNTEKIPVGQENQVLKTDGEVNLKWKGIEKLPYEIKIPLEDLTNDEKGLLNIVEKINEIIDYLQEMETNKMLKNIT